MFTIFLALIVILKTTTVLALQNNSKIEDKQILTISIKDKDKPKFHSNQKTLPETGEEVLEVTIFIFIILDAYLIYYILKKRGD